jgi:hypothetical protein
MKVPVELVFVDAMLFVECVDMYSATKKGWLDKTEFDCIIFGRSPDEQIHAIVIEVKAYTDIEPKELDRQKQHLAGLKNDLFDSYNHIVLISYDNLIYASENLFKTIVNPPNNVLILTWDDFKIEIKGSDRFFEKDFHLYKTLHKDGLGNNLRHMMKK